ncbi:MAG: radical SAM protein [Magnetospirillum sp.]|nr:radical SAM protein [Magnetospirillum sp.]
MARLYSNLKFLRYAGHIEALRHREVVAPVHVRIKPMNHCNHSCWYCAYRVDNLQLGDGIDLKDQIPAAKMHEIVDDVIAMGVQAVTFSGGGEPLLYKPLPQMVERLGRAGVRVASLTNGSNLRGAVAEAFAQWGTWIRVSTDAWDDESFARSRGIALGQFTRLLDNIRAFTARGSKCVLGVSFIIGHDNAEHVYEVCRLMKDAGVDHVKLSGAVVANDRDANNDYHRRVAATVTEQIRLAQGLSDDKFTIVNHYHELEELFDKTYTTCPFLLFLTVIGADCSVYACQDKAYTASGLLGSIRDRSFREFWFSEENRRRIFSLDPSRACLHHCISHGKNLAINEVLALDPDHACFV